MFFIITGGIILELVTITESYLIKCKSISRAICTLGKKGYKVDHELANAFFAKELNKQKQASGFHKLITNFIFFLPGLNLIKAFISSSYLSYKYQKDTSIRASLIPMTFEENFKFKNSEHLFQKAGIATYVKSENNNFIELKYNALPNKYSLAEVKRLSSAIHAQYKIGVMQEQNVAIIGLSPLECMSNMVLLNQKMENFENLPSRYLDSFIVYPYGEDYHDNDALQTCMASIEIQKNYQNNYPGSETKIKGKSRQRVRCP